MLVMQRRAAARLTQSGRQIFRDDLQDQTDNRPQVFIFADDVVQTCHGRRKPGTSQISHIEKVLIATPKENE